MTFDPENPPAAIKALFNKLQTMDNHTSDNEHQIGDKLTDSTTLDILSKGLTTRRSRLDQIQASLNNLAKTDESLTVLSEEEQRHWINTTQVKINGVKNHINEALLAARDKRAELNLTSSEFDPPEPF